MDTPVVISKDIRELVGACVLGVLSSELSCCIHVVHVSSHYFGDENGI